MERLISASQWNTFDIKYFNINTYINTYMNFLYKYLYKKIELFVIIYINYISIWAYFYFLLK